MLAKKQEGNLFPYLSLSSPWHILGGHGQALTQTIYTQGGCKWQLLVQETCPLSTFGYIFFLCKILPDRLPRLKEEGHFIRWLSWEMYLSFWPPLSWCMVLLHGVACLQHCISQAKAGPGSTVWILELLNR